MAHKMSGLPSSEDKLNAVAQQVDTMARVGPVDIMCPYCGGVTEPNKTFCCDTIIRALSALADARDKFGFHASHLRN